MAELAQVLRHVKTTSSDPALLVGLDTPDDAAVYRLTDDLAIVQTVDFFTPIVDDARAWGRIAAANSLSDIYAMGARPVTAMNIVGWPRSVDFELLGRVLEGAEEACAEAGVSIVGGHSVDDSEPKYGLAVTGLVRPDAVIRKVGAPPGSELFLTKPLGMGIISTAIKQGRASHVTVAEATRIMQALNKEASAAMVEVGVAAATDVTGFGLVGHLMQMLGTGVGAVLDFQAIPMVEDAVELARLDLVPGGSKRNLEALRDETDTGTLDAPSAAVLFDAQTSGGLLIAVAPERAGELGGALERRGVLAARIGMLVPRSGGKKVSVQ
jgi:selenide,water dikinase